MSIPPRLFAPNRVVTSHADGTKFNPNKKSIREHPLLITNLFDFDRSGVESRPSPATSPPSTRARGGRFNRKSKSLASLVPLWRFPINSSDDEGLPGLLGRDKCADRRQTPRIIFGRTVPRRRDSPCLAFSASRDRTNRLYQRRKFRGNSNTVEKYALKNAARLNFRQDLIAPNLTPVSERTEKAVVIFTTNLPECTMWKHV